MRRAEMILRWAVVLLAVLLPRIASGKPKTNADSPEQGLVLVGALASPEERTALRDLYASVLIAVQGGMESGVANDCPTGRDLCFGHVESYDDLIRRARMTNQIADRGYLRLATMRSVSIGNLELRGYAVCRSSNSGRGSRS